MYFNKLKCSFSISQRKITCLVILIITYFVVHLYREEEPDSDCFPKDFIELLRLDSEYLGINSSIEVKPLRAHLERLNREREVRNEKYFGPVGEDTPYLVVCVRRAPALRLLLAALARLPGLDDTLLVFSHAYYDSAIDHLIQQIDFCMVLQIYYLNSVQLNPNGFPGYDAEYSNASASGRRKRDPLLAEAKHHWWWTAHYVFERLPGADSHAEMVIFIDESSYVLPDMLFMFAAAQDAMRYFPGADVISLGRTGGSEDYEQLTLEGWQAAHGDGLAFNRSTWRKISALGRHYCEYDDASWSRSLERVFARLPAGRALALGPRAGRVLAAPPLEPRALRRLCRLSKQPRLFPRRVQAVVLHGRAGRAPPEPRPPPGAGGGWSDTRDILQCFQLVTRKDNVTAALLKPK